jgi:hypothetical protein
MQVELENLEKVEESKGLAECIEEVYRTLGANAVLLLGEMGQVLARIGQLPDPEIETALLPQLAIATGLGARVSILMECDYPDNLLSFRGKEYDLYLSNVGEVYMLMVVTPVLSASESGEIASSIQQAVEVISKNLFKLGISIGAKEKEEKQVQKETRKPAVSDISDPQMETLLAKEAKIKKEEADAFWESAPKEQTNNGLSSSDSLTYEQAKKLGLAPEDQ